MKWDVVQVRKERRKIKKEPQTGTPWTSTQEHGWVDFYPSVAPNGGQWQEDQEDRRERHNAKQTTSDSSHMARRKW